MIFKKRILKKEGRVRIPQEILDDMGLKRNNKILIDYNEKEKSVTIIKWRV